MDTHTPAIVSVAKRVVQDEIHSVFTVRFCRRSKLVGHIRSVNSDGTHLLRAVYHVRKLAETAGLGN